MTVFERDIAVCFSGHRSVPAAEAEIIRKRLDAQIGRCVADGKYVFICGGAVGFDMMAAEEVIRVRMTQPDVRLILALPCHDQTATWNNTSVLRQYKAILSLANDVIYISKFYETGCYHARNRWMADHSSVCIAYLKKQSGGTYFTVDYAAKSGLSVVNLAENAGSV